MRPIMLFMLLFLASCRSLNAVPLTTTTPEPLSINVEVSLGCVDVEANKFQEGETCTIPFVYGYKVVASATEGFYIEAGDRQFFMIEGAEPIIEYMVAMGEETTLEARGYECTLELGEILEKTGGKATVECKD